MCGPNSRGDTVAGELHRGSIEEAGKQTVDSSLAVDCSLAVDLWLFIEDVAIVLSVRLISYLRLHGF